MADISQGLTADELRSSLYSSFRGKGILNSLKSQLRSQIVTELRRSSHTDALLTHGSSPINPLTRRIVTSLVAEHMKTSSYDYSLAVFLPESRTTADELLPLEEIMQILKLDNSSSFENFADNAAEGRSFIWTLVSSLMKRVDFAEKTDACQQTEMGSDHEDESLVAKMKRVDADYAQLEASHKGTYQVQVEERMQAYQRQCDGRAREEAKMQTENFKKTQLVRMRMEEQEKFQKELKKIRNELETSYVAKAENVKMREQEMEDMLKRQRQDQEAQLHGQRQALLAELDALRMREMSVKRDAELYSRSVLVEEQRIQNIADQLRFKEASLNEAKTRMQVEFQEAFERFKLEYMEEQRKQFGNVELKKAQLEEKLARVQQKESRLDKVVDELAKEKALSSELKQSIKSMDRQLESSQRDKHETQMKLHEFRDYGSLKREKQQLKKESDILKEKVQDLQKDLEKTETTHKSVIRELTSELSKPSTDVMQLRGEIKQVRENARKEQLAGSYERQRIVSRWQEEREKNRELLHEIDQRALREREMKREVTDLRLLMDQAQTAYTAEMHRSSRKLDSNMRLVAEDLISSLRRGKPLRGGIPLPVGKDRPLGGSPSKNLQFELDIPPIESASFLQQTKQTFDRLEKEAKELEKSYQDFQQRLADGSHVYKSLPSYVPKYAWEESLPRRKSSGKVKMMESLRHGSRTDAEIPLISRRKDETIDDVVSSREHRDLTVDDLGFDEKKNSEDSDRSSSGSNLKMSQVSHSEEATVNLAESVKVSHQVSEEVDNVGDEKVKGTAASLDVMWKSSTVTKEEESGSDGGPLKPENESVEDLDDVGQKEKTESGVDGGMEVSAVAVQDDDWEIRRRQREEDRRKREEEAWRREQEELAVLEKEQERRSVERERDEDEVKEESRDVRKAVEGESGEVDGKIDPTMLQYMKLLSQKKEQEKQKTSEGKTEEKDFDWSIRDESCSANEVVSGGGGASDEEFDW